MLLQRDSGDNDGGTGAVQDKEEDAGASAKVGQQVGELLVAAEALETSLGILEIVVRADVAELGLSQGVIEGEEGLGESNAASDAMARFNERVTTLSVSGGTKTGRVIGKRDFVGVPEEEGVSGDRKPIREIDADRKTFQQGLAKHEEAVEEAKRKLKTLADQALAEAKRWWTLPEEMRRK